MPNQAKLYIGFTIALGIMLMAICALFDWQFSNTTRYLSFFLLAVLASTLKVRLPGITGTMSVNFLFVLIGIAEFTLAETLLMGCLATLVQCVWRSKRRRLVQVTFNIAALALSIGFSYSVSHWVMSAAGAESLAVLLALAGCLFFVANTVLVSGVVSLVERKPLQKVWQQCYLWSFPYYLVGAAIAGLTAMTSRSVGWPISLLILPVMYLVYTFYRLYLERVHEQSAQLLVKNAA